MLAELVLESAINARDLAQERGVVIAQRVVDFIGDRQTGEAQQAGVPELQHAGLQLGFVRCKLARRQRVLRQGSIADLVAQHQQPGDVALRVQDALALHFRWMGGQHRRDVALRQRLRDHPGRNTGPAQPRKSGLDAAFLRVAGALVQRAPPDVMAVLGKIGEVAEIGECADHADCLLSRERLQQRLQCAVRLMIGVAAECDRQLADALHQFESCSALLLADGVAQDAPQQPDVFAQRSFVVFGAACCRVGRFGGCGHLQVLVGALGACLIFGQGAC